MHTSRIKTRTIFGDGNSLAGFDGLHSCQMRMLYYSSTKLKLNFKQIKQIKTSLPKKVRKRNRHSTQTHWRRKRKSAQATKHA